LVVGHYQPLADNSGVAPESDQTCSAAVGSENTRKTPHYQPGIFQLPSKGYWGKRLRAARPKKQEETEPLSGPISNCFT
jgi:hypothetical protein